MRFGFLLKRGRPPEGQALAEALATGLRRWGCEVVFVDDGEGPVPPGVRTVLPGAVGAGVDVLVVLGGDGTFLYGASLVADHGVPLLGINLGGLGFMTHYVQAEAETALEAACAGRLPIDERMRLDISVQARGAVVERRSALNEAVVQRSAARLPDLQARLDGDVITTYKADGLIVSTPTGSTAYNLAAGGPILTPDVDAIVLTPICPHTLTNRPVVMRADAKVVITNVSTSPALLVVDGQWSRELAPGEGIEARKASRPLRTFRAQGTFFSILRQKLSWGEREG